MAHVSNSRVYVYNIELIGQTNCNFFIVFFYPTGHLVKNLWILHDRCTQFVLL